MDITIGKETFKASMEENKTSHKFMSLFPTTLSMDEMNGNEKYCYLGTTVKKDSEKKKTADKLSLSTAWLCI